MPRLRKLQHVLLALLFACAAGAALWWLWVIVEAQGEELAKRIQTIENEQAFDARFNELTAMVEETAAERAQLERYILDGEDDTIALLSQLDEISDAYNVELSTSELNVSETGPTFDELVVGFNIAGSEDNVIRMIELFETLPYHGSITALSIERSVNDAAGARQARARISLTLTIKNYDQ